MSQVTLITASHESGTLITASQILDLLVRITIALLYTAMVVGVGVITFLSIVQWTARFF